MAQIDATHFLVVQDTKYDQPGDRIGVLSVDPAGGYDYTPLSVDWPLRPANDLESCYGFRTKEGEFLAAESGSYHEDWQDPDSELYQGRIFHLKVTGADGDWHAEVLQTYGIPLKLHEIEGMISMRIPVQTMDPTYVMAPNARQWMEADDDDEDATEADDDSDVAQGDDDNDDDAEDADEAYDDDDVGEAEAPMAITYMPPVRPQTKTEYRPAIVLATRGGDYPYEVARVYWGYVDFDAGTFELTSDGAAGRALTEIVSESPYLRGCSDMYVDDHGCVWVASCEDLGDGGPFRSYVVRYGSLNLTDSYWSPPSLYHNVDWTLEGVKIEALGAPVISGGIISFATDDEGYGGIWRPLGPPEAERF